MDSRTPSILKPGAAFVCSWSGGKDSSLALYRAIQAGARPAFLLTILHENGERSRSHGLPLALLQAQARALGVPLVTKSASWSEYEGAFIASLQELKGKGVEAAVFGDVDIEAHREWDEKVCRIARMDACLPLWKAPRRGLLEAFLALGLKGMVVAAQAGKMGKRFLGKELDRSLIAELTRIGIDPSGEAGEYHTVVTDGPIFRQPLDLEKGQVILRSGCWFLDVHPAR